MREETLSDTLKGSEEVRSNCYRLYLKMKLFHCCIICSTEKEKNSSLIPNEVSLSYAISEVMPRTIEKYFSTFFCGGKIKTRELLLKITFVS